MSPIREKKKKNKSRAALFRFSFVFFFSSSLHLHAGVISTASLVMGNDAAVDERVRLGRKIPPSTDRNFHGILATSTVATRRFPFWFGFFFFYSTTNLFKPYRAILPGFSGRYWVFLMGFLGFFFLLFCFFTGCVRAGDRERRRRPQKKKPKKQKKN